MTALVRTPHLPAGLHSAVSLPFVGRCFFSLGSNTVGTTAFYLSNGEVLVEWLVVGDRNGEKLLTSIRRNYSPLVYLGQRLRATLTLNHDIQPW